MTVILAAILSLNCVSIRYLCYYVGIGISTAVSYLSTIFRSYTCFLLPTRIVIGIKTFFSYLYYTSDIRGSHSKLDIGNIVDIYFLRHKTQRFAHGPRFFQANIFKKNVFTVTNFDFNNFYDIIS